MPANVHHVWVAVPEGRDRALLVSEILAHVVDFPHLLMEGAPLLHVERKRRLRTELARRIDDEWPQPRPVRLDGVHVRRRRRLPAGFVRRHRVLRHPTHLKEVVLPRPAEYVLCDFFAIGDGALEHGLGYTHVADALM